MVSVDRKKAILEVCSALALLLSAVAVFIGVYLFIKGTDTDMAIMYIGLGTLLMSTFFENRKNKAVAIAHATLLMSGILLFIAGLCMFFVSRKVVLTAVILLVVVVPAFFALFRQLLGRARYSL